MEQDPIVPPFEHYSPSELTAHEDCLETAFTILHNYGKQRLFGDGDTLVELLVSDRVDSLKIDEEGPQGSIRLRSVPMDSSNLLSDESDESDESDSDDFDEFYVTQSVVAVLEYGVSQDEEYIRDDDFSWSPIVAIIAEISEAYGVEDIFICDAQTGVALEEESVTQLSFLLMHLQKNLQAENVDTSARAVMGIEIIELDDVEEGLNWKTPFVPSYCEECGATYATCHHNGYSLN